MGDERVDDEDNVGRVGHGKEEVESLTLERLIGIFEALDHNHLVVQRVLLVDLHDPSQGLDAEVLEVVVLR